MVRTRYMDCGSDMICRPNWLMVFLVVSGPTIGLGSNALSILLVIWSRYVCRVVEFVLGGAGPFVWTSRLEGTPGGMEACCGGNIDLAKPAEGSSNPRDLHSWSTLKGTLSPFNKKTLILFVY